MDCMLRIRLRGRTLSSTSGPSTAPTFSKRFLPRRATSTAILPDRADVSDFLASSDGHALVRASMRIRDPAVRGSIVRLIEQIAGDVGDRYCWRIRMIIRNKNNAISCGTSADSCMGKNALEGRVFILLALHLPRRGSPTRLLGQRCGLEARPRRRGPAR